MYGLVRSSLLCLFTTLHTTSEVNGKIARCVQVETSYSVNMNYYHSVKLLETFTLMRTTNTSLSHNHTYLAPFSKQEIGHFNKKIFILNALSTVLLKQNARIK